jgi:hypothetical protein
MDQLLADPVQPQDIDILEKLGEAPHGFLAEDDRRLTGDLVDLQQMRMHHQVQLRSGETENPSDFHEGRITRPALSLLQVDEIVWLNADLLGDLCLGQPQLLPPPEDGLAEPIVLAFRHTTFLPSSPIRAGLYLHIFSFLSIKKPPLLGGFSVFFSLLKSLFYNTPINGVPKRCDIISTFETIVDHKCMFKNIHHEKRHSTREVPNVMFINPNIE